MKSDIRKKFLKRRNSLSKKEVELKSRIIVEKLKNIVNISKKKKILSYMPINNEVDVIEFNNYVINNATLYIPKVEENSIMKFYRISNLNNLQLSKYNILEPYPENELLDEEDIVIVPMIAYNLELFRLGYGGGYYDRYFENRGNSLLIGVAFENQKCLESFQENNDIKLDMIVTECNIYKHVKKNNLTQ